MPRMPQRYMMSKVTIEENSAPIPMIPIRFQIHTGSMVARIHPKVLTIHTVLEIHIQMRSFMLFLLNKWVMR